MNGHIGQSVAEVYQDFILAKTAEGVSDITITCLRQEYYLHPVMQFGLPTRYGLTRYIKFLCQFFLRYAF